LLDYRELKMKLQTKLVFVAVAFTPVFSSAMADPLPASVNPRTVRPLSDDARRALVPPPITEPCRAELSVNRFEISRRADRRSYDITVTVANSGTEAAGGGPTNALGIRIDATSIYRPRTEVVFSKQVANIDVIHPGTSRSFAFSLAPGELPGEARDITVRLDRGPDGPRCAYDARRSNDGLGIGGTTMRAWFDAGNASYVRVAPWAM
jgi:hypothetical protein